MIFQIFFDWDQYVLTPDGEQLVDQAAQAYKANEPIRIQVTGYTDLSGPTVYNQRLSERRANVVAIALEVRGVSRNDILETGRGMNDPRIPTAPGVREPENRRAEITVR